MEILSVQEIRKLEGGYHHYVGKASIYFNNQNYDIDISISDQAYSHINNNYNIETFFISYNLLSELILSNIESIINNKSRIEITLSTIEKWENKNPTNF